MMEGAVSWPKWGFGRELLSGQVWQVSAPFLKNQPEQFLDGAPTPHPFPWRPGRLPADMYDSAACDGMGLEQRRILSVHSIPGYPRRVFYTTTWVDPDGKSFGKKELRCASIGTFYRWLRNRSGMPNRYEAETAVLVLEHK